MQSIKLFTHLWSSEDVEDKHIINIYGLNPENEDIYLRVRGFRPWVYIELPTNIKWDMGKFLMAKNSIISYAKEKGAPAPSKMELVFKEKLYYANIESSDDVKHKKFPYIQAWFDRNDSRNKFSYLLKNPIYISSVGKVNMKCHEQNASPVLQFTSSRKLPTAGWISSSAIPIENDDDRQSLCVHEYFGDYKFVHPIDGCTDMVSPLVLSMDIEVNSSNPSRMPNARMPKDDVRMISCIFFRQGTKETDWEKVLLTLGEPDPEKVGDDVEIRMYDTEADLLVGYAEIIREKNPQIVIGYNILAFDYPYMIDRARESYNGCIYEFDQQGVIIGKHGTERTIKWSSGAFSTQEFRFLDCDGRLLVDLLPMVKREFKFDSYNLKTVSDFFLGETKDPLTPKGIFKCFRINSPNALGIVGKYCIQDAVLVAKMFEHLSAWQWLTEKAKVCNVPIFTLYSQGQQITTYSQIYKECLHTNIVVETNVYQTRDDEHYSGAYVFPPVPGLYNNVVPFDFSSLYPTIIIAYNIDYHTLVQQIPDPATGRMIDNPDIPDSMCNVFEWEDHIGCIHDTTVRKTKVKNVMCAKHRFRFLKEPKGVLPTILTNLLDARKKVNKMIEENKARAKTTDDPKERDHLLQQNVVLDKRQLSLKVSANSMYGAMGVSKGYLPFMPGAMCTTARGRQSIEKASGYLKNHYKAELIYGDTDSCYVHFPGIEEPGALYDHCERIENEMMELFPRPMKLAFEGKVYWRFFILTKKRYMALTCDRKGKVSDKMFKRGVVLSRRDNSGFIRSLYSDTIMKIFYKEPKEEVMYMIYERLKDLFRGGYTFKDFVITKSVGEIDEYKTRDLPEDPVKRQKKLDELGVETEEEYKLKMLPSQAQLAERMRRRGKPVQAGSRIEHVVCMGPDGIDGRMGDKVEDIEYFKEHAGTVQLDYYYYLRFAANPLDQLLEVAYGEKPVQAFYKYILKRKKLLDSINLVTNIEFN